MLYKQNSGVEGLGADKSFELFLGVLQKTPLVFKAYQKQD